VGGRLLCEGRRGRSERDAEVRGRVWHDASAEVGEAPIRSRPDPSTEVLNVQSR
jgi:hypothetical protein